MMALFGGDLTCAHFRYQKTEDIAASGNGMVNYAMFWIDRERLTLFECTRMTASTYGKYRMEVASFDAKSQDQARESLSLSRGSKGSLKAPDRPPQSLVFFSQNAVLSED